MRHVPETAMDEMAATIEALRKREAALVEALRWTKEGPLASMLSAGEDREDDDTLICVPYFIVAELDQLVTKALAESS